MLRDRISTYSRPISSYSPAERAPIADTVHPVASDSLTKHQPLELFKASGHSLTLLATHLHSAFLCSARARHSYDGSCKSSLHALHLEPLDDMRYDPSRFLIGVWVGGWTLLQNSHQEKYAQVCMM